jgi:hypothetical protein
LLSSLTSPPPLTTFSYLSLICLYPSPAAVLRSDVKCRLFLLYFLYRKENLDLVFKWYSSRLVPLTMDLGMVPYAVESTCETNWQSSTTAFRSAAMSVSVDYRVITQPVSYQFLRMRNQRVTKICACSVNQKPLFAHAQRNGKFLPIRKPSFKIN